MAWHESPTGAHRLRESRAHTGLDGSCPLPEASCCLSSEQRTVSCERNKKLTVQAFSCWTSKNTQRCFTSPTALSDRGLGSQRRGLRTPLHRRVRGASKKFFCRKFICKVALVHFQLQDVFYVSYDVFSLPLRWIPKTQQREQQNTGKTSLQHDSG